MSTYADYKGKIEVVEQIRDLMLGGDDEDTRNNVDDFNDEINVLRALREIVGAYEARDEALSLRYTLLGDFNVRYRKLLRGCGIDVCEWCAQGFDSERGPSCYSLTVKQDAYCHVCHLDDGGEHQDEAGYMREDEDSRDMDSDPYDRD